jgi:hypothetical protein
MPETLSEQQREVIVKRNEEEALLQVSISNLLIGKSNSAIERIINKVLADHRMKVSRVTTGIPMGPVTVPKGKKEKKSKSSTPKVDNRNPNKVSETYKRLVAEKVCVNGSEESDEAKTEALARINRDMRLVRAYPHERLKKSIDQSFEEWQAKTHKGNPTDFLEQFADQLEESSGKSGPADKKSAGN